MARLRFGTLLAAGAIIVAACGGSPATSAPASDAPPASAEPGASSSPSEPAAGEPKDGGRWSSPSPATSSAPTRP